MTRTMSLRAWSDDVSADVPEDDLARRPLALCLSGGGFRSYACVTGQLRALSDRGVLDDVGMISAVSGGAWAAAAYAYAPGEVRARLGETIPASELTLDALAASIDELHLAHPVTQMDAMAHARSLDADGVDSSRLFSRVLGDQLLAPLGIDTDCGLLAGNADHLEDLLARNPDLDRAEFLTPQPGRAPVVTGASMMLRGSDRYRYIPVELAPSSVTAGWPVEEWPVRSIELPALIGAPRTEVAPGLVDVELDETFGLDDLLAATGGAPGGVLVEVAAMLGLDAEHLVLRAAHWLGLDAVPFLVDGGYVENTGLLAALRRGADRLVVLVNSNVGLMSRYSPFGVEGFEGQLSRLFDRRPTLGPYSRRSLRLFEDDLPALSEKMSARQAAGELPWAIHDHRLVPDNVLGLPDKTVRILWQLNEVPQGWASRLPDETQRSLATPFAELYRIPHFGVAFAQGGYLFRLRPAQVGTMAALHDHALRSLPDEVWEALLAGPGASLPDGL